MGSDRPLCVLTAGRSGSSLAARVLNILGVYLGEADELMSPSAQNERGYWEHMAIYGLNEELLTLLGGSWYRPPALSDGWESDQRLDDLRDRAAVIVRALAGADVRWGFKDPRTVVLLPFWRTVIHEMDYVICVRSPHAFARSVDALEPADGDTHLTALLWLEMNAAALRHTISERRIFVFYEDWFEGPVRVATELASFVHGERAVSRASLHAAAGFFDANLCHSRRAPEKADEHAGYSELDAMYAHLRLAAARASDGRKAREHEVAVADALTESYRRRAGDERDLLDAQARVATLQADLDSSRTRAEAFERSCDELRDDLAGREKLLEAVLNSQSWRITAPFRALRRHARGRLGEI